MKTILYINDEHCTSIEQLKSYFSQLEVGSVFEDMLDYGRHGDMTSWLQEKGYLEYAEGMKAIDSGLGDADFIKAMSKVLSGEESVAIEKKPYNECFSIEEVLIERKGDKAEVILSIMVHKGVNESYEIKVSSNWGTKGELFNPSEQEENRLVKKTIEYNRRAGKGEFGEVSVEVEGEKIEVKIEGSHSKINGHEYVDLGLPSGLKWATCNVGANSPEEYGDYFAWGETTTKADYSPSSSRTHRKHTSDLGWLGYIYGDNLRPQYDAATANWGAEWRMPTKKDMVELIDNCEIKLTQVNGVKGSRIVGPNGNSIFLPAAGYRRGSSLFDEGRSGDYWSSTWGEVYGKVSYAWGLSVYASYYKYKPDVHDVYRSNQGLTIRPVVE